jgi:hypothetical protein
MKTITKTHRERAEEIIEKLETGDGFANYDYITNLIEVALDQARQDALNEAVEAVEKAKPPMDFKEAGWFCQHDKDVAAIKALKGE